MGFDAEFCAYLLVKNANSETGIHMWKTVGDNGWIRRSQNRNTKKGKARKTLKVELLMLLCHRRHIAVKVKKTGTCMI